MRPMWACTATLAGVNTLMLMPITPSLAMPSGSQVCSSIFADCSELYCFFVQQTLSMSISSCRCCKVCIVRHCDCLPCINCTPLSRFCIRCLLHGRIGVSVVNSKGILTATRDLKEN